jgi:hypothetical protein
VLRLGDDDEVKIIRILNSLEVYGVVNWDNYVVTIEGISGKPKVLCLIFCIFYGYYS